MNKQQLSHWALAATLVASVAMTIHPCTAAVTGRLAEYRAELAAFCQEFGGSFDLPDTPFFLFGMGPRTKLLYKAGALIDSVSGKVLWQWATRSETIVPPDYTVWLTTADGQDVRIFEDEQGVWIEQNRRRQVIEGTQKPVRLPAFAEHRYPQVMACCIRNC
jgi:hypothetical protein